MLNQAAIWVTMWIVYGLVYYIFLNRRGVDIKKKPILSGAFFVVFSLGIILVDWDMYSDLLGGFSWGHYLLIFVFLVLFLAFFPLCSRKCKNKIKKIVEANPGFSSEYMLFDRKTLLSRIFQVFMYQLMILYIVDMLIKNNYSDKNIMIVFGVGFGVLHAFLMKRFGSVAGLFVVINSAFGGLFMAWLLVVYSAGPAYTFMCHMAYYMIVAIIFMLLARYDKFVKIIKTR